MTRLLFLVASFSLTGISALAQDIPEATKQEYCSRTAQDFQNLLLEPSSRMAFDNYGGMFGSGVCWWHSRLQRYANYLAVYAPELPRPTDKEASKILSNLINAKGVTLVPGFRNFYEFSAAYEAMIAKKLEGWQKKDGIVKFVWIKGLKGGNSRSAKNLRRLMDELHSKVNGAGEIVFTKLQLPGIVAHAWLIFGMEKLEDGYKLRYIDSNYAGHTETHIYRDGDTDVPVEDFEGAGLYENFTGDLKRVKKAYNKLCKKNF